MVCPLRFVLLFVSVILATIGLWYATTDDEAPRSEKDKLSDVPLDSSFTGRARYMVRRGSFRVSSGHDTCS